MTRSFPRPFVRLISLAIPVFLALLFSCEEEVNRPVFRTLEVSDLNDEGVTLNAKFQTGSEKVRRYGFVWGVTQTPLVSSDMVAYIGNEPSGSSFQFRLEDHLVKNTTYNVRAFVIDDDAVFYANTVRFVALGSAAPVITGFSPTSGNSLDEIVISGKHFGTKATTQVKIGPMAVEINAIADESIYIAIPAQYNSGAYPIEVTVMGKTAVSAELLTLEGPVIESISPSSGAGGTVVTITGKGFSSTPSNNVVYFGTSKAMVTSATSTELKVVAPMASQAGIKEVTLTIQKATSISPIPFTLTGPVITSISPASGKAGDIITITGSGFSAVPSENNVTINPLYYVYGEVLSASPTQLEVKVQNVYYNGYLSELVAAIRVMVKNITAVSPQQFSILGPKITSFTPSSQYQARTIVITGENFVPGQTAVWFDQLQASVLDATGTTLTVTVPYEAATPSTLTISAGSYTHISPMLFTVLNPWQRQPDFPGGARYGVTTFTVGAYSYLAFGIIGGGDKKDVWRFDPSNDSWTRMADFPGTSRAFAFAFVVGDKAYVGGGGHYTSSSNLIASYYDLWEYDPSADSWTPKQGFSSTGISGLRFPAAAVGQYGYFVANNFLFRYDAVANSWFTFLAPATFPEGGVAAGIDGKVYFGLGVNSSQLWEYDPTTTNWSQRTSPGVLLPGGWGRLTSFVFQNKLYISSHNRLMVYDAAPDTWTRFPNLPGSYIYKGGFASSTHAYLATGLSGTPFPFVYKFDPTY